MVSPVTTVKTKSPSLMNMAERSSMSAIEAAIRLMMPKGAVLGKTRRRWVNILEIIKEGVVIKW